MNLFDSLEQQDGQWPAVISQLLPRVHAVDRDALRIWFGLWPLPWHALAHNPASRPQFEKYYQVNGSYRLIDQVDTSHRFLYGHRYWVQMKGAISGLRGSPDLASTIEEVARASKVPLEFALAMAAIGLMTLRQVGWEVWQSSANSSVTKPVIAQGPSAEAIIRARASDYSPTLGERLRGKRSTPRVVCDEQTADGWFPLIPSQHITTAAELDKRPHHLSDPRCYEGMGIIPVDCRSGACGTCWVGILGGQENLSEITPFERQRMDYFGYFDAPGLDTESSRPLLRLACQAQAFGSISMVIPPWNAVWGRSRRERAGQDATITL